MCGRTHLLILLLGAVSCLPVKTVRADTMNDAIAEALAYHPSLKRSDAALSSAKEFREGESAAFLPHLSVGVAAGRVHQDNATSRGLSVTRGSAYSGYGEGNVALNQMIFDGMESANRVRAAEARVKSERFSMNDTQRNVTLNAIESYIDALRIRSALILLDQHVQTIASYNDRITDMVIEGVSDEAELQQAADVMIAMQSVRADYEGQMMAAEAAYIEAVGKPLPQDMEQPQDIQEYIERDAEIAIKKAKEIHPTLQAARFESRAAKHDANAVNADFYPDITGELSYNKIDKDDIIGGENKDARALVRMSWDISLGGRELSAVRQKKFDHYEARAGVEETERKIEKEIRQAYAMYKTLHRKSELLSERVELNKKLLNAYNVQFEGARVSLLQIMKMESQLFNTLLESNDNKYNFLLAQYKVLASLGQLGSAVSADDKTEGENAGESL